MTLEVKHLTSCPSVSVVQPIPVAFETIAAMTVRSIRYLRAVLKRMDGVDIVDPFCDFDIAQYRCVSSRAQRFAQLTARRSRCQLR